MHRPRSTALPSVSTFILHIHKPYRVTNAPFPVFQIPDLQLLRHSAQHGQPAPRSRPQTPNISRNSHSHFLHRRINPRRHLRRANPARTHRAQCTRIMVARWRRFLIRRPTWSHYPLLDPELKSIPQTCNATALRRGLLGDYVRGLDRRARFLDGMPLRNTRLGRRVLLPAESSIRKEGAEI